MKTNYLAVCIAIMAALCGCGRSPEAEGKAMSEKLTAAQLFEVTMQNALMAAPNVGSLHAQRYEQFCQENGVPLNKPILDLLKKGFPEVQTTVSHKILRQSMNPTRRDDIVYRIDYRLDASNRSPVSYLAVFEFIIAATPQGTGVIQVGGFDEINGVRTVFTKPAQVIVRIGLISRGMDNFLADLASKIEKMKRRNQK